MAVDTSALIAILLREPYAALFDRALAVSPIRLVSAVMRVELSLAIEGRKGEAGRVLVDLPLRDMSFDVACVTPRQADMAILAFRRFGKGRHPAALNIGNRFSYVLAVATGHPLLFKGDGFSLTDIRPALPPTLPAG
jgi:ribonuclease VapC